MQEAATLAGVFPFLEALQWPLSVPLFELRNPRSGSSDQIAAASFSFMKALSCAVLLHEGTILFARGVPGIGFGDVGRHAGSVCLSCFGLGGLAVFIRVMCCTYLVLILISSINERIRKLCVFLENENEATSNFPTVFGRCEDG